MAFENTFPTWRSWLQRAGFASIDCERGLQINDSAAVIQAAIAGNGVALGRTTLVARDLAEGRLVRPFGRRSRTLEVTECDANYVYIG